MFYRDFLQFWQALCQSWSGSNAFGDIFQLVLLLFSSFKLDPVTFEPLVKDTTVFQESYDFIILGTGTTGSVVASRLSEVDSWEILALENGGNENAMTDMPALTSYMLGSEIDWKYQTAPTDKPKYCKAMVNGQCNLAAGNILGGSSAISEMLYVRGNKEDYENWEKSGLEGWDDSDVLSYFRKSEDNQNAEYSSTKYHSTGGLLMVSEAPYTSPIARAFIKAGEDMDYKERDVNGKEQIGFMIPQATIKDGKRVTTAKAFLRSAKNRKNLHVSMNSRITKILIDAGSKKAKGVEFVKDGKTHTIFAKKEVILSSGAIASPKILMLSGIGIKEHLEALNIPVIKDLKVGNNLQDHYGYMGMIFTIDKPLSVTFRESLTFENLIRYISQHDGPLTALPDEAIAFINTKHEEKNEDIPQIQLSLTPSTINADPNQAMKIHNIHKDNFNEMFEELGDRDGFTITPYILSPKSRGTIRLGSSDPFDQPLVDPNYFGEKHDVKVLTGGIRFVLDLVRKNSFKKMGAQFYNVSVPGCKKIEYGSDEYWECAMKHLTTTYGHYSGTCKMGTKEDKGAVVDKNLKVWGIANLRVVDGSIMPTITSGNTQAALIMIAEKGAAMIKKAWLTTTRDDPVEQHFLVKDDVI